MMLIFFKQFAILLQLVFNESHYSSMRKEEKNLLLCLCQVHSYKRVGPYNEFAFTRACVHPFNIPPARLRALFKNGLFAF